MVGAQVAAAGNDGWAGWVVRTHTERSTLFCGTVSGRRRHSPDGPRNGGGQLTILCGFMLDGDGKSYARCEKR